MNFALRSALSTARRKNRDKTGVRSTSRLYVNTLYVDTLHLREDK